MVLSHLASLTAPPTQSLHTLRPTPSTISFTVSTRPRPTTLAAKVLAYIAALTRVLLGLAAIGVVWTKWQLSSGRAPGVLEWALGEAGASRVAEGLGGVGWVYVCCGAAAVGFGVVRRGYTEESLTLLRGLGLQTCTSPPTYLQSPRTRFLPTTHIQDLFIHEAFRGFEVRFYLGIVVKGEEDVVVVFPQLLPRREMLEEVWRGARGCLWEGGGGVKGG